MGDTDFIVNGVEETTCLVENLIKAADWEEIHQKNLRYIPEVPAFLSVLSYISPEQYSASLNSLATFKDISTYIFPERTRFKFFKRLIRRFLRVSANHQQAFNNALLGLLQSMTSDIQKIGNNQTSIANYLVSQETAKMDLYREIQVIGEMARSNQKRLDESDIRTRQEVEAINSRLEILKDLGVDLFSDKELIWNKRAFSQAGEDNILSYIFETARIPLDQCDYIDLGANHPRFLSNTYLFYQAGARGVLVEANPKLANDLRFYRHRDIVLNSFVSSKSGQTMDFYILNGDGLSTSDYSAVQEFIKENSWLEVVDTVKVNSVSVNEVIAHLGHAPKILNIDIEGKEMEILETIDFKIYRPMVVIVEMIPYRKTLYVGERNKDIIEFMERVGYIEFAFTGINSIFIDKESFEEPQK
jgi:FkbM family methyltransferase